MTKNSCLVVVELSDAAAEDDFRSEAMVYAMEDGVSLATIDVWLVKGSPANAG
jgi:mannose/fructose/N-acetylgalactosamine-specific phosphotransferase system component IIB